MNCKPNKKTKAQSTGRLLSLSLMHFHKKLWLEPRRLSVRRRKSQSLLWRRRPKKKRKKKRRALESLIIDPPKMPKRWWNGSKAAEGGANNTHSRVHVQEAGNRKRIFFFQPHGGGAPTAPLAVTEKKRESRAIGIRMDRNQTEGAKGKRLWENKKKVKSIHSGWPPVHPILTLGIVQCMLPLLWNKPTDPSIGWLAGYFPKVWSTETDR